MVMLMHVEHAYLTRDGAFEEAAVHCRCIARADRGVIDVVFIGDRFVVRRQDDLLVRVVPVAELGEQEPHTLRGKQVPACKIAADGLNQMAGDS